MSTKEILIIEDNHITRDSLRMFLEFEEFNVRSCEDGPSAIALAQIECFDVVLVDYRIPGMNGDKVTELLRRFCPETLIIGFSVELKERAFLDAGADFFISKHSILRDLVPLIRGNATLRRQVRGEETSCSPEDALKDHIEE